MRSLRLLVIALLALGMAGLVPPSAGAKDLNCSDFATQAQAQRHLNADPSDPDYLDRVGVPVLWGVLHLGKGAGADPTS